MGIIKNDKISIEEEKISPSSWKVFLYFMLTLGMILLITFVNKFIQNNANILLRILIFIPVNLILFLICSSFVLRLYEYLEKKDDESLSFAQGYIILVFIIQIAILYSFIKDIHNEFYLPKGLKNIEYIKCKLNINNSNDNYRLLYFNDKFIFIETKKEGVKILKFEEFLNDENCK